MDLLGAQGVEQKGSGSVHIGNLDFYNTKVLAGERRGNPHTNTLAEKERVIREAKTSAQGIRLDREELLPWQLDKQCKLYSTSTEVLKFQIQWLKRQIYAMKMFEGNWETEIQKYLVKKAKKEYNIENPSVKKNNNGTMYFVEPEGQYPDLVIPRARLDPEKLQALWNQLVAAKMKLAQIKAESKFRKAMACWILGKAHPREYKLCHWIKYVECNGKLLKGKFTLAQLQNILGPNNLTTEYKSSDSDYYKEVKDALAYLLQSLMRSYPSLTQGFIKSSDHLNLKGQSFIDELKRTAPKTEEEVYLFYKYIVGGRKVDFDHLCSDDYTKMFSEDINKPENWKWPPSPVNLPATTTTSPSEEEEDSDDSQKTIQYEDIANDNVPNEKDDKEQEKEAELVKQQWLQMPVEWQKQYTAIVKEQLDKAEKEGKIKNPEDENRLAHRMMKAILANHPNITNNNNNNNNNNPTRRTSRVSKPTQFFKP